MIQLFRQVQAVLVFVVLLLLSLQSWSRQTESSTDQGKDQDDTANSEPLTSKAKLSLAIKESVGWPMFIVNAGIAYGYHLQRQNPSYGDGFGGYGKRYAV